MRFGFHISIAGGFSKVVRRALIRGCETFQLFSRNPRGWRYEPLDNREVEEFRRAVSTAGLSPVSVHVPYLVNISSKRSAFYEKSIDSIATDLERAHSLGAEFLIVHIGHRLDSSEEEALDSVVPAIDEVLRRVKNPVTLLLENTAGQGSEFGSSFEQIRMIIERVQEKERLGVCLDTAHCFEAGYDISTEKGVDETIEKFDRTINLERLRLIHLNDSKTPLGSAKDRHWHIGEGQIGLRGLKHIVNHPLLARLPAIMETPRFDTAEDLKNMAVVRSLVSTG